MHKKQQRWWRRLDCVPKHVVPSGQPNATTRPPSSPAQESTLPLSSIYNPTESSVGTFSASADRTPVTSELTDGTAVRDGDCESREGSCALDGAVRTLDVTSGLAPSGTPTAGSTLAPDADDWVSEGLPTPTQRPHSKPRKRGKTKKKTKNTHLRFESSDAEDSASADLPLSLSVSLSGGVVGSG